MQTREYKRKRNIPPKKPKPCFCQIVKIKVVGIIHTTRRFLCSFLLVCLRLFSVRLVHFICTHATDHDLVCCGWLKTHLKSAQHRSSRRETG